MSIYIHTCLTCISIRYLCWIYELCIAAHESVFTWSPLSLSSKQPFVDCVSPTGVKLPLPSSSKLKLFSNRLSLTSGESAALSWARMLSSVVGRVSMSSSDIILLIDSTVLSRQSTGWEGVEQVRALESSLEEGRNNTWNSGNTEVFNAMKNVSLCCEVSC